MFIQLKGTVCLQQQCLMMMQHPTCYAKCASPKKWTSSWCRVGIWLCVNAAADVSPVVQSAALMWKPHFEPILVFRDMGDAIVQDALSEVCWCTETSQPFPMIHVYLIMIPLPNANFYDFSFMKSENNNNKLFVICMCWGGVICMCWDRMEQNICDYSFLFCIMYIAKYLPFIYIYTVFFSMWLYNRIGIL